MYDIAQFNDGIRKSRIGILIGDAAYDVQDAYKKGGIGRGIGQAIRSSVGGAMLAPVALTDDVMKAAQPVTNFAGQVGRGLFGIDDGIQQATPAAPATAAAAAVPPKPAPVVAAQQTIDSPTQPQSQSVAGGYGMAQGGVVGQQTSVPGITKLTGGGFKSPMFTDDPARAMAEYSKGPGVNTVPASAFTGGPSPSASAGVSAALQAAAARGDYGSIADFYQRNGGTFNGKTSEQDQIAALQKTITAPNGNMTIGDMLAAKSRNKLAIGQIAALRAQPGLDAQAAQANAQAGQAQAQTQGILAGIPLTQAKTQAEMADAGLKQQHAALTKQLADTDPADTQTIASLRNKLAAIAGKTAEQDKYILADVDTGQQDAMGQPIFKKIPFNQRTGQYASTEAVGGDKRSKIDAITAQYQSGKLSKDEARAQLSALGLK